VLTWCWIENFPSVGEKGATCAGAGDELNVFRMSGFRIYGVVMCHNSEFVQLNLYLKLENDKLRL
jgi:hypothetical protein